MIWLKLYMPYVTDYIAPEDDDNDTPFTPPEESEHAKLLKLLKDGDLEQPACGVLLGNILAMKELFAVSRPRLTYWKYVSTEQRLEQVKRMTLIYYTAPGLAHASEVLVLGSFDENQKMLMECMAKAESAAMDAQMDAAKKAMLRGGQLIQGVPHR